jgi:hypothetical protein
MLGSELLQQIFNDKLYYFLITNVINLCHKIESKKGLHPVPFYM